MEVINLAVSIMEFEKEFTRAVSEGYAAVFAGAGLSRDSGYINWKELIKPFAKEIGLDVEIEHDLVAITQYYQNERGTRNQINQKILNEFTRATKYNKNVDILTKLPIDTYWTTNYDSILEEGLKKNNRKADIKITQKSLANNIYDRDAVVYKMHGDKLNPDEAVLTKDDYEMYGCSRPLFRTVLQGDLISKTFLFIGFSFEDPNLEYILSQIRVLLGESIRDHYCFFRKVKQDDDMTVEEYHYELGKQELRIKDLRRYGIQAILVDEYKEITDILEKIETGYLLKSIFISGSISEFSGNWDKNKVENFTHSLAKMLVQHDYKIVSGFGLGIGSTVINGALEEIHQSKYKHIDEHLCLRPFPQIQTGTETLEEQRKSYRTDMIIQSGIAIFLFGNKIVDNETVIADGMLKEFEIAKEQHKIIIPIGSAGYAAKEIFDQVEQQIDQFQYLKPYLTRLSDDTLSVEMLISLIYEIIESVQFI
jgi:adenylate kinase family enzyme